jgi:hypothetical protein
MKKTFALCYLLSAVCAAGTAHALSLSGLFGGDSKVAEAAGKVLDTISPEEQVKKLIDKCATPTTDGVCECVANAVLANLTQNQWKIVNHYMFDTRATIPLSDFLIANPWIIPKIATPYLKCSGKN